jgi:2-amino-4-hydroxy-6-hydroxymethyldihydropteridine diphosphokinase
VTRVVLSLGSNLGDRRARLQAVVDELADRFVAVSPVYETAPWGGVEQGPFLNAVVIAEDPDLDGQGWLALAQQFELAAERVRGQKWGPRSLDVDLVTVWDLSAGAATEVFSRSEGLTLPHPFAHLRAFVLIPWLDVDPDAVVTVDGEMREVARLLGEMDPVERAGVERTDSVLHGPDPQA